MFRWTRWRYSKYRTREHNHQGPGCYPYAGPSLHLTHSKRRYWAQGTLSWCQCCRWPPLAEAANPIAGHLCEMKTEAAQSNSLWPGPLCLLSQHWNAAQSWLSLMGQWLHTQPHLLSTLSSILLFNLDGMFHSSSWRQIFVPLLFCVNPPLKQK